MKMVFDATNFKYKWMPKPVRRIYGLLILVLTPIIFLWFFLKSFFEVFLGVVVALYEENRDNVIPLTFGKHVIRESHGRCDCEYCVMMREATTPFNPYLCNCPECAEQRGKQFARDQYAVLGKILPNEVN